MHARRLAFCRRCNGEAAQTYLRTDRPGVEMWRCVCGSMLMSLGDIPDADGFAVAIAERWLRNEGIVTGEADRDEVHAEARAALWVAFLKWDASRGLRFRSYAAWKVGNLLTDWIRGQRGRTYGDDHRNLKPHADALSLDDDGGDDRGTSRLDGLVAAGEGDAALCSSADLTRALELGGRRLPRQKRGVGGATYARAS